MAPKPLLYDGKVTHLMGHFSAAWETRAVANWAERAARNNAELCDIVCRSHGLSPRFEVGAWTSRVRTPMLYPDAVTLVRDVSVADLMARIDDSPGASIKDSFSAIDLTEYGYRVLFEARWIVKVPQIAAPASPWSVVDSAEAFVRWEAGWRGSDGPRDVLRASLLDDARIIVAEYRQDDAIVAGALFNCGDDGVGVSNVFSVGDDAKVWAACAGFAHDEFPGATLVGYESGDALAAALGAGFEDAGPLRIWVK
jgi:hypothetical protein